MLLGHGRRLLSILAVLAPLRQLWQLLFLPDPQYAILRSLLQLVERPHRGAWSPRWGHRTVLRLCCDHSQALFIRLPPRCYERWLRANLVQFVGSRVERLEARREQPIIAKAPYRNFCRRTWQWDNHVPLRVLELHRVTGLHCHGIQEWLSFNAAINIWSLEHLHRPRNHWRRIAKWDWGFADPSWPAHVWCSLSADLLYKRLASSRPENRQKRKIGGCHIHFWLPCVLIQRSIKLYARVYLGKRRWGISPLHLRFVLDFLVHGRKWTRADLHRLWGVALAGKECK